MKFLKILCTLSLSVALLSGCATNTNKEDNNLQNEQQTDNEENSFGKDGIINIGILQLAEHDALEQAKNGFIDGLKANGYEEGKNVSFDIQNAQNDQSNLKTMSQRFVNNNVDLILGISTSATQSLANETTEIPILGTAITDFVEANLVESNEKPGGNVSGTSDKSPVDEQIDLMIKLLPDLKTVGVLYNSSEANSQIQAENVEKILTSKNLNVEFGTVTNTNDVSQSAYSLAGKVDAIYIPTDNTIASTMATIGSISEELKIPVIVAESGLCKNGGLATVGMDFYKLGVQTADMAVRLFNGEDISTMPIELPQVKEICINLDMAKNLGITIPQDIIDNAAIIIENGEVKTK